MKLTTGAYGNNSRDDLGCEKLFKSNCLPDAATFFSFSDDNDNDNDCGLEDSGCLNFQYIQTGFVGYLYQWRQRYNSAVPLGKKCVAKAPRPALGIVDILE